MIRRSSSIFNPLSPNSDQHQFSPNNIHTLSKDKVMRINKDYQRENEKMSKDKVMRINKDYQRENEKMP